MNRQSRATPAHDSAPVEVHESQELLQLLHQWIIPQSFQTSCWTSDTMDGRWFQTDNWKAFCIKTNSLYHSLCQTFVTQPSTKTVIKQIGRNMHSSELACPKRRFFLGLRPARESKRVLRYVLLTVQPLPVLWPTQPELEAECRWVVFSRSWWRRWELSAG